MRRGADLLDSDLAEAEVCYRRALEMDPSLSAAWFDLGLIHKWRKEWTECLACNRQSIAVGAVDGSGEPAYWNAGIAATALCDWETARWAWRGYGVSIDDGAGPIDQDFGQATVRLPTGEVVWGKRLDPARMRLLSIPLPDSGHRCGDVVLHDGAPEGHRVVGGREYPVFDWLVRVSASSVPTTELVVRAKFETVEDLQARLDDAGIPSENWSESIVLNCVACSHGRVDFDSPDHSHPRQTQGQDVSIGCSGARDAVVDVATDWATESGGVVVEATEVS